MKIDLCDFRLSTAAHRTKRAFIINAQVEVHTVVCRIKPIPMHEIWAFHLIDQLQSKLYRSIDSFCPI